MSPALRLSCFAAAVLAACCATTRADEPAGKDIAADGTVSVIVEPSTSEGPARRLPAETSPVATPALQLLAETVEPLEARAAESLYARPLPLLEALERSGDRSRRLWITQAYWKVWAGFALVRHRTAAVERLELVAPGAADHDRAALDAAAAVARAELADARTDLIAAQQELVDLVRLPVGEPLPWPVDRPLVAPYQTHFDTIFATRAATGRVRAINRMLPGRHEAVDARAAAVAATDETFDRAEADHAKGLQPVEAVVAAQAALAAQQREFVQAVKAYNCDIAEYVMSAVDLSVPDDRFAAMLIGTPIAWRQQGAAPPSAVIAAGATVEGAVPAQAAPPGLAPPVVPPVPVPPPGLVPPPGRVIP
jgi:hypothetical protein